EAISVDPPMALLVDHRGALFGYMAGLAHLRAAQHVQRAAVSRRVEPDGKMSFTVVVARPDGFISLKRVSIALHILKSFPVIRHKKKTLSAILPENMRSATSKGVI